MAIVMLVAVSLAGCGGGGDSTQTGTETAATEGRAAYVAEADALCAEMGVEAGHLAESAEELRALDPKGPEFRERAAAHFAAVLEFARTFAPKFRELDPPPADRERVDQFLAASRDATDTLEDVVAAFRSGQDPGPALDRYGRELAKADRLAEAYGFEVCGRISGD